MSQSYQQRVDTVEGALAAQKIRPPAGCSLTDVAMKVLHDLDHIPESIR